MTPPPPLYLFIFSFLQQYWEYAYEDILDVIAKMPEVAALIYRCKFKDGKIKKDLSLDYTGNYCTMMGYDDKKFQDLMRLYLVIHSVRGIYQLYHKARMRVVPLQS